MKYLFYLILAFTVAIFVMCCKKSDDPVNCSNGYAPDSNNECSCPTGSIETYGQCWLDEDDVLFGVAEGCPCEEDTILMRILGRTTTPYANGRYMLNLHVVSNEGIVIGTGMEFVPTPFGYDSLITGVGPSPYSNCEIDGWNCQRKYFGRVYGNDSIVLNFFYTRPDIAGNIITMPQTCKMVVRN